MSEESELRRELAETAVRAYRRGLVAGTGGNVSARIGGRGEVLITPTGLSLEMATPENLVRVDLDGAPLDPHCAHKPSMETGFHCAIYRVRPEVNAVVHVHPPHATAFSLADKELPLVTVSAAVVLRRVPWVDVALPGSGELPKSVAAAFSADRRVQAILMRAHGIVAAGRTLVEAYDVADTVETTARIALLSAALGIPIAESVETAFRPLRHEPSHEYRGGGGR